MVLQGPISPERSVLRKLTADCDDLAFFHAKHTHTHARRTNTAIHHSYKNTGAILQLVSTSCKQLTSAAPDTRLSQQGMAPEPIQDQSRTFSEPTEGGGAPPAGTQTQS